MSYAPGAPDVDPKHLVPEGPPHPDRETEIAILRWGLGYREGERDPFTGTSLAIPA